MPKDFDLGIGSDGVQIMPGDGFSRLEARLDRLEKIMLDIVGSTRVIKGLQKEMEAVWAKVDAQRKEFDELRTDFRILKSEHTACKPTIDTYTITKTDFDHRLRELEKDADKNDKFFGSLKGQIVVWFVGAIVAVLFWAAGKGAILK